MHKVGDKFEVVAARMQDDLVGVGDIVTYISGLSNYGGYFSTKDNKKFVAEFEGANAFISRVVRPYRTEAEKRGAKFGVTGVVKETSAAKHATGKKILFVGIAQTVVKEEVWNCVIEGEAELATFFPSSIRLDHEPEYKEIPFSEATHEQRMDVGNLWHADSPVVRIVHFDGYGYAFTITSDFEIRTDTSLLTVRIPA